MTLSEEDVKHLRLLEIFHYVYAGLNGLFSSLGLFYAGVGVFFLTAMQNQSPNPPPKMMGWMFTGMGAGIIVLALASAALYVFTGRCLRNRRYHTFCLIIAGLSCLNAPLGTILGVFTFLVLLRPQVKVAYGLPTRPAPPPPRPG